MPGPTPKDPKLRQRRNRAATRARLIRAGKPRIYAPRLPDRGGGQDWHKLTRDWWHDIWHSPMAEEYLEADRHALFRLAALIDAFWQDPSVNMAREIRLEQQAFGLTPLDRRRLEWSIEQAEAAQDRTEQRRVRTQREEQREEDPRKVLKTVAK